MEERLADNRLRILVAARKLVAEGGFRAAQISAVAAEAGLSTGSIYRYFPSKAELFAEVLAIVSSRERDVLAAIVDGDGTPAARLRGAVQAFGKRALKGHRLAHAMIVEPCEPDSHFITACLAMIAPIGMPDPSPLAVSSTSGTTPK